MAKTMTAFKCDRCGATATKGGKPFDQKTLNLHKAMHCPQKPVKGASGAAEANCCQNPSYRLLTAQEHALLAQRGHTGYRKVCETCQEVI